MRAYRSDDMTTRRPTLCFVLLLLGLVPLAPLARGETPATQPSDIVIERTPPDVQTRTFDPKNPPPEMPPLREGEAAVTQSSFTCQTLIAATIIDQHRTSQGCTATVRVTSVKTTITLGITIWLPVKGSKKLTAHEDGHRLIDETFYDGAEAVARRLSMEMLGQRRVGKGSDCDTAAQTAMEVTPVKGAQARGYLYHLTDHQAGTGAGAFRELHQGTVLVGPLTLSVTILTHTPDTAIVDAAFVALTTARYNAAPKK
jgi:hypothetical protein